MAKVIAFSERATCTVKEALEASGLGKTTLYGLINGGRIETVAVGRRRLVKVQSLLALAGEAQPATPTAAAQGAPQSDLRLGALVAVVEQWRAVLGDRRVSARQVIERATKRQYREFRDALLAVAGDGVAPSARRLGKWLGWVKGRPVDGWCIAAAGISAGVQMWRLEPVAGATSAVNGAPQKRS
jgi:excisionase family DNA binding protein